MCTSAPWPDPREALLAATLPLVDPRLTDRIQREFAEARLEWPRASPALRRGLVIAGHRAAGKSRLLPVIASALGRPPLDLDAELERQAGIPLREFFRRDPAEFRKRERTCFRDLPLGSVVAVGGGFLSLHADLLDGYLTVEVPVSEATYRERLLSEPERPRLRPELSIEEEVATVFREREMAHSSVPRWSLAQLLAWMPLAGPEGAA